LSPTIAIATTAYTAVLVSELVGDKMLYTATVLGGQYRAATVFAGLATAYMAKMGVAVLFGHTLARLPPLAVGTLSLLTFAGAALVMWRKPLVEPANEPARPPGAFTHGTVVAFSAIFFAEWGDVGQLTAAALAAQYGAPWTVWIAGTCAMCTKGVAALAFGRQVSRHIPAHALRYGAVAMFLVLALLSALRVD
jgi:putative Ca2+/H+ antiporter (TMEM165/GDT1 family)